MRPKLVVILKGLFVSNTTLILCMTSDTRLGVAQSLCIFPPQRAPQK